MALFLVSAGAIGALAGSIDTSTTDATTSTSDLANNDSIQFDADQSDAYTVQAIVANTTTPEMRVELNDSSNDADGVTFHKNTTLNNISVGSGGSHWNATFNEGDLADVPVTTGTNQTVDIVFYNASNSSDVLATATVTLVESGDRTVLYLGDSAVENNDDIETFSEDANWESISDFNLMSDDHSEVSDLSADVNGSSTNVTVVFANESVADDYSNAVASDADEGDWLVAQASFVGGTPVKVYNENAPDDVDEEDTYGVYSEDIGGETGITYTLGDDHEDADSLEVKSYGNQQYGGLFSVTSIPDLLGAFGTDALRAYSLSV